MSIYSLTSGLKHCAGSVYDTNFYMISTPQSQKQQTKQTKTKTNHSYNLQNPRNTQPKNFEIMMHRTDYFMKKYHGKQESQEKDWKPSIRTYPTEVSQQSVSPSVSQRKQFYQPKRNPILLSPSPGKPKKQNKKTCLEKVLKKEPKEGIRAFKQANSSDGFIASLQFSTPHNKPITIISPRYGEGVQMRQIFQQ